MKFNIIVSTQISENYGAHDWNGRGECPQYWKQKGGEEYRHPVALDLNEAHDRNLANKLVEELSVTVTRHDKFFTETVVDWYFLPVGELTESEEQQTEWYGSVKYPVTAPRSLAAAYAV